MNHNAGCRARFGEFELGGMTPLYRADDFCKGM